MKRRSMGGAVLAAAAAFAAVPAARADGLAAGREILQACLPGLGVYCGTLAVPLDRGDPAAGTVAVGFELYPRRAPGRSADVVLAQEGGPGYSTTFSRDGYLGLLAPLRADHDVLLIDKRGTGRSGAFDCPALQAATGPSPAATAACGQSLGVRAWHHRSVDAADDIADVVAALGYARASYYGDSYGALFGQVLAATHPGLLTAMVLDGAYPAVDDPDSVAARHGPAALDIVCRRSPSCAALGSSAGERLRTLVERLRRAPVAGTAPDQNGQPSAATADPASLFAVIAGAGNAPTTWRDLDAAGRALVEDDDALPLLRLVAETQGGAGGGVPVISYSAGLADAVQCADGAMLFDYSAPVEVRRAQVRAAVERLARERPDSFAPFTVAEATDPRFDALGYDECVFWPGPPPGVASGRSLPAGAVLPPVPALVLSGELDTVTSPRQGQAVAAALPKGTFLLVPNGTHETAVADEGVIVSPAGGDLARCVGPIVARFLATGGDAGDTSCVARLRPIRTVPRFSRDWSGVAPAAPAPGNAAGDAQLRLASAAAETVGDALGEFYVNQFRSGAGLRGGTFAILPTDVGYTLRLAGLRWAETLSVDGTVDWDQTTGAVTADLRLSAPGHAGTLRLSWNDLDTEATMRLDGTVDGVPLAATRIAP